ncbi:sensor histidine kinase [Spongiactinospora sp. 9N601]|uniref:sensor histidine kinase n=1 Tax=Spongiactinospora sp. 9N601 TaxID=3375149 RepID=UPI0037A002A7
MSWLGPDEGVSVRSREVWVYLALAYALLVVALLAALLLGQVISQTWVFVGLAALWLPWMHWLYPRRRTHQAVTIVHYVGILALGGALVATSVAFTLFLSIGYPLAGVLFPKRAIMIGVAATAITTVVAQSDPNGQGFGQIDLITALLGLSVPLLFVGWQVGLESERRRKANQRLQAALAENAGLHAQLVAQAREAGVLDERQRLAREIHDTIAQDLVALIGQVRAAEGARDDVEEWRRHADQIAVLAGRALTEARRSVRALQPEPLDGAHLPDALADLAGRWSEGTGITPDFDVTGAPRRLVAGVEVTIFRVAQEALSNIAKHAKAERVGVTLDYLDDTVLLDVRDDGTGFDESAAACSAGFGLDTMRQRARGVGGSLTIESSPGQGTAVALAVPAIPADPADPETLLEER